MARNLGPADLLEYPRDKLKGLLLEEGSAASHAAIVARALQIPCVGRLMGLRDRLSEGDMIIADGETGEAYLRPRPDMLEAVQSRMAVREQRQAEFAQLRDVPAVTLDGQRITVLTNAGLAVDLENMVETGAEGIGLFRTEFQFMVSDELPRLNTQTALYKLVLDAAGDKPVTFRTLDIGGDKVLPYLEAEREENPALGRRAIRLGLDRPSLLRMQLRALLAAGAGRELRVMFPMIATVDEFRAARELVDIECAWARRRGRALPALLRVGAMVECPSLLWHLDALLPLTDFVSIGTNGPVPVHVRRRPDQSLGVGPLRPPVAANAACAPDHPEGLRRHRHAGLDLRRAGRPAAGGLRPDHPGLHPSVGPGGGRGAGQTDDPVGGPERGAARHGQSAEPVHRFGQERDPIPGAQA